MHKRSIKALSYITERDPLSFPSLKLPEQDDIDAHDFSFILVPKKEEPQTRNEKFKDEIIKELITNKNWKDGLSYNEIYRSRGPYYQPPSQGITQNQMFPSGLRGDRKMKKTYEEIKASLMKKMSFNELAGTTKKRTTYKYDDDGRVKEVKEVYDDGSAVTEKVTEAPADIKPEEPQPEETVVQEAKKIADEKITVGDQVFAMDDDGKERYGLVEKMEFDLNRKRVDILVYFDDGEEPREDWFLLSYLRLASKKTAKDIALDLPVTFDRTQPQPKIKDKPQEGPPYEVLQYKCPKCDQVFEVDNAEGYEQKCPDCGNMLGEKNIVHQYVESGKAVTAKPKAKVVPTKDKPEMFEEVPAEKGKAKAKPKAEPPKETPVEEKAVDPDAPLTEEIVGKMLEGYLDLMSKYEEVYAQLRPLQKQVETMREEQIKPEAKRLMSALKAIKVELVEGKEKAVWINKVKYELAKSVRHNPAWKALAEASYARLDNEGKMIIDQLREQLTTLNESLSVTKLTSKILNRKVAGFWDTIKGMLDFVLVKVLRGTRQLNSMLDSVIMDFNKILTGDVAEATKKTSDDENIKDSDDAEEIALSFVNGNISWTRKQILHTLYGQIDSIKLFNAVLTVLEEKYPDSVESFRRLMTASKKEAVTDAEEGGGNSPIAKFKVWFNNPKVMECLKTEFEIEEADDMIYIYEKDIKASKKKAEDVDEQHRHDYDEPEPQAVDEKEILESKSFEDDETE